MWFKIIVGILAALALNACASGAMSWDNIRNVKVGTTEAELIAIMGKPYRVNSKDGMQTWVWISPMALSGASVVSFGLRDGRVVEVPNVAPFQ